MPRLFRQAHHIMFLEEGESSEEQISRIIKAHPHWILTSTNICGFIEVPGTGIKKMCVDLFIWEEE